MVEVEAVEAAEDRSLDCCSLDCCSHEAMSSNQSANIMAVDYEVTMCVIFQTRILTVAQGSGGG